MFGKVNIGGGVRIKNKQNGEFIFPRTEDRVYIDINHVDWTNCILRAQNLSPQAKADEYSILANVWDYDTIVFDRFHTSSSTRDIPIKWEVIEFENFKQKQRGDLIKTTTSDSFEIPIKKVNPQKTMLFYSFSPNRSEAYNIIIDIQPEKLIVNTGITSPTVWKMSWFLMEFN